MMATAMHQLQILIAIATPLGFGPNVVLLNGILHVKDDSADGTSPALLLKQRGFSNIRVLGDSGMVG